jgi:recombinational DNA repair protein (RecF pathway)
MLTTSKGIIIHTFKFGETSAISKIYTPDYGLVSVIFKGAF